MFGESLSGFMFQFVAGCCQKVSIAVSGPLKIPAGVIDEIVLPGNLLQRPRKDLTVRF